MSDSYDIEKLKLDLSRIAKMTISPFSSDNCGHLNPIDAAKSLLADLKRQADLLDANDKARLLEAIDIASYDLEHPANGIAVMSFYLLGMVAHDLSNPVRDSLAIGNLLCNLTDVLHTETLRTQPIKLRNSRKEYAKEIVQKIASDHWSKPKYKEMRVSEMAEHVWKYLHAIDESGDWIKKETPDKAAGLVPWLREVAPATAKRPGRPPTVKK